MRIQTAWSGAARGRIKREREREHDSELERPTERHIQRDTEPETEPETQSQRYRDTERVVVEEEETKAVLTPRHIHLRQRLYRAGGKQAGLVGVVDPGD